MKYRNQKAFSLLEVLIVASLITILGAMTMPAIRNVREKANAAKCMSNMRQLGMGMIYYSADNLGQFPKANENVTENAASKSNWIWTIWEYCGYKPTSYVWGDTDGNMNDKHETVFVCPTRRLIKAEVERVPDADKSQEDNRSYAMNVMPVAVAYNEAVSKGGNIRKNLINNGRFYELNKTILGTQANTAMLIECEKLQVTPYTFFKNGNWRNSGTGILPHSGGSNVLFFDGRAEWYHQRSIPLPTYTGARDNPDFSGLAPFWSGLK